MKTFKFVFILLLALVIVQCSDGPIDPLANNSKLYKGGNGNGGNGNGGGGNGGGQDYGDLVVCFRDVDGIPIYEMIDGEHGLTPYPLPIKFDEATIIPEKIGDVYQTFDLNAEGEVIEEAGYIVKEVEFGRLNLVRAPQPVLDHALQEAKTALTQPTVTAVKTDASGRLVAINGAEDWLVNIDIDPLNDEDNDKTIDSPRENMALYQELMTYGLTNELSFLSAYFTASDVLLLAIGAVAAGADKTGNIIVDEIAYMNDWIIDWVNVSYLGPDEKDRRYFNFGNMVYNRASTYANKYVKITTINPDGSWSEETVSILNAVQWTSPERLIDYAGGLNTKITGFANAADDAVQVLEFIHSSDLIVYNPYFVP
jgi:hypothetical protein